MNGDDIAKSMRYADAVMNNNSKIPIDCFQVWMHIEIVHAGTIFKISTKMKKVTLILAILSICFAAMNIVQMHLEITVRTKTWKRYDHHNECNMEEIHCIRP